jgi:hypothetical protein
VYCCQCIHDALRRQIVAHKQVNPDYQRRSTTYRWRGTMHRQMWNVPCMRNDNTVRLQCPLCTQHIISVPSPSYAHTDLGELFIMYSSVSVDLDHSTANSVGFWKDVAPHVLSCI